MDVWDGVVEFPLLEGLSRTACLDIGVVVNAKLNFVPKVKGYVKSLEEVVIKADERVRGSGAGGTLGGKVPMVLGPCRTCPVGRETRPVGGEDQEGGPSFALKTSKCPAPKICGVFAVGNFLQEEMSVESNTCATPWMRTAR